MNLGGTMSEMENGLLEPHPSIISAGRVFKNKKYIQRITFIHVQ